MNFQQLKIIREAARQDYNLTEVANMLYTSQSGVLTIATTHTQARYSLPPVIKAFRELFSDVRVELVQGTPQEIEALLHNGGADIGIASERLSNDPTLAAFPWFRWHHSLLVPKEHPLTQVSPLTLEAIARWPLITYRQGITGRSRIDEAFNRKGLMPDIVLSAQDSDVIKTYVELGLGVGLVAEQSGDAREADTFTRLDTRHLFDANTVWLGLKRGQLQRNYVWRFIELCNAGLSLDEIKRQAMEPEEVAIDYQI